MSDASRTQLQWSLESVFGETPSSPVMQALRFTREGLKHNNASVVSAEIRADRMRSDLLLVGTDVSGNIEGELSLLTWASFLEAAMCGTWSTAGNSAFTDGVSNSTTTYTSATATFATGDVGKVITGTNIPPGTYIASRTNATTIILSQAATGSGSSLAFTIVARTANNVLLNGTTNRSFLFERGYLDVSQFFQFVGCTFEEFNLAITARDIIGVNCSIMGAQAYRSGATVAASTLAANTLPPITAGPAITQLETNTGMTGIFVRSLNLQVKNNLRTRPDVQSRRSQDYGRGPLDITGTFEAYFKTGTIYDQFLANSAISFTWTITDPTTGRYLKFTIPVMKLPDADPGGTPGIDADTMQTVQFRGLFDAATNAQLKVERS